MNKTGIALAALGILGTVSGFVKHFSTEQCGLIFDHERRTSVKVVRALENKYSGPNALPADDVCSMSLEQLTRLKHDLDDSKLAMAGQSLRFRYEQQLSDDQRLNVDNWNIARGMVMDELLYEQARSLAFLEIDSGDWEALGPGNIGGRIRSFAFDPDNSDRIYAGAVSGGVWLTENNGQSWYPTDDFMGNLSISTLLFDKNNSDIIYAGTGEGTGNFDRVRGMGIFKSPDKGKTWVALDSTQNNYLFYAVNRLAMVKATGRLLAATSFGIFISDDEGGTWQNTLDARVNDIDTHPTDSDSLVAGAWGSLWYSSDGGSRWAEAQGLPDLGGGRVEIAISRSNPDIVYASIDRNKGELWKSNDNGRSYRQINSGLKYLGKQGWYNNAIWIDPVDSDHIIVGGINLWRSNNGGRTFTEISDWTRVPRSAHADNHFILEHPDYDGVASKSVYFANDGGMYLAKDIEKAGRSSGWTELNNELAITQFYGIGIAPNGNIIGGTQDNGTLVYRGDSELWTKVFGGDGGFSAADPENSQVLYGEYVRLHIHRSTNGGQSSQYIYEDRITEGANFIAPFILDPNQSTRLLAGSEQLWVTNNAKARTPSWRSIKSRLVSRSPISAIAVAKGNSDIIYVAHNDGSIFKTLNGQARTPVWEMVAQRDMPQRFAMRIAIDETDSDTVYVSFGGYEDDNLWQTRDGGQSWHTAVGTRTSRIPPAPIRAIAIDPADSQRMYVGTEVGIYFSEDAGGHWQLENKGPANVSVDDLVWDQAGNLYAATHGRGVFVARRNANQPDDLQFEPVQDAPLNTFVVSSAVTISGLNKGNAPIAIDNGEYAIGCDNNRFTTGQGTINNGQTVCIRHRTSSQHFEQIKSILTIGDGKYAFTSTTLPDVIPDPIVFLGKENVVLQSEQISEPATVTGIQVPVMISVRGGEYAIDCNERYFTTAEGEIAPGQRVCVRHTASALYGEKVTTVLTIAGAEARFSSTTVMFDNDPDDFFFKPQTHVPLSTLLSSSPVTIRGINGVVKVTVENGELSPGCNGSFSRAQTTVQNGNRLCVRHTSAATYDTSINTIVTVGKKSAVFTSRTALSNSGGDSPTGDDEQQPDPADDVQADNGSDEAAGGQKPDTGDGDAGSGDVGDDNVGNPAVEIVEKQPVNDAAGGGMSLYMLLLLATSWRVSRKKRLEGKGL